MKHRYVSFVSRVGDLRKTGLRLSRLILMGMLVFLSTALGQGCASSSRQGELFLPPITAEASGMAQPGRFVWFELLSEAVPESQRFYEGLFGWEFSASERVPEYINIFHNGKTIGGMIALPDSEAGAAESLWLCSLLVADVDLTVEKLLQQGGTVLEDAQDIEGRGRMAIVQDQEGAPFILLRAADGDPVTTMPEPGDWIWVDLFSHNSLQAGDFYSSLAGFEQHVFTDADGNESSLFHIDGHARAGLVGISLPGVDANWLPYVRVVDLDATLDRARSLGGSLILRQDDAAILADPGGAAIGIQEFHEEMEGGAQ